MMLSTKRSALLRYETPLLTLALVGVFEAVFTIEWSFPYCLNQQDGPASAVFGMPLPYIRWAGVSSMEYEIAPLILVINILILFVLALPLISWLLKKLVAVEQKLRRKLIAGVSVILLLFVIGLHLTQLLLGVYKIPVTTLDSGHYGSYSELRPVRFGLKNLHYDCTPSTFWFPAGWNPK